MTLEECQSLDKSLRSLHNDALLEKHDASVTSSRRPRDYGSARGKRGSSSASSFSALLGKAGHRSNRTASTVNTEQKSSPNRAASELKCLEEPDVEKVERTRYVPSLGLRKANSFPLGAQSAKADSQTRMVSPPPQSQSGEVYHTVSASSSTLPNEGNARELTEASCQSVQPGQSPILSDPSAHISVDVCENGSELPSESTPLSPSLLEDESLNEVLSSSASVSAPVTPRQDGILLTRVHTASSIRLFDSEHDGPEVLKSNILEDSQNQSDAIKSYLDDLEACPPPPQVQSPITSRMHSDDSGSSAGSLRRLSDPKSGIRKSTSPMEGKFHNGSASSRFSISKQRMATTPKMKFDYRKWTSLSVGFAGFPTTATIEEIVEFFETFGPGLVTECHLDSPDELKASWDGSGNVVFKHPHKVLPFWERIQFFGTSSRPLRFSDIRQRGTRWFDHNSGRIPEHYSFKGQKLHFGLLRTPKCYSSEWATGINDDILFHLNARRRRIEIQFDHAFTNPVNDDVFYESIRFEVSLAHIDAGFFIYHRQAGGVDANEAYLPGTDLQFATRVLTFATRRPPLFFRRGKKSIYANDAGREPKLSIHKSAEQTEWKDRYMYHRATEIRLDDKSEKHKGPLSVCEDEEMTIQLGKWLVYRIVFCLPTATIGHFDDMVNVLKSFNLGKTDKRELFDMEIGPLATLGTGHSSRLREKDNLKVQLGESKSFRFLLDSSLPFELQYMVESLISLNVILPYDVTPDFMAKLLEAPVNQVEFLLELWAKKRARIWDPLQLLTEDIEVRKLQGVQIPPVPAMCQRVRKIIVTPTAIQIQPPSVDVTNRVLRRFASVGDNFIRVQFCDEAGGLHYPDGSSMDRVYARILRIFQRGITVGGRHFVHLASGTSQLREHGAWFFSNTDEVTADMIRRWMGDFSAERVVSKYAARMGQCFTTTRDITTLTVEEISMVHDVQHGQYCFSDGVGRMSLAVATLIARSLGLDSVPSAVQMRLGGAKGMLVLHPPLPGNKIQIRPSQLKFDSPHKTLEVVRASNFASAYLNRQIIIILSGLGVSDSAFIDLQNMAVESLDQLERPSEAVQVLTKNIDQFQVTLQIANMVKAGFLRTKDAFVHGIMTLFRAFMLREIKYKARIHVEHGALLLGVMDETSTLREGEIYVRISNQCSDKDNVSQYRVIQGRCIVVRNPAFHPGDIRVVKAVNAPNLRHLCDVVVFPQVGERPLANTCSGGDLDGDEYTILWLPELIPPNGNHAPMDYTPQRPKRADAVSLAMVQKWFVNYIKNDTLGLIANSHLAWADQLEAGVLDGRCLRLAQLHSDAVDFPKSGRPASFTRELKTKKYPDFMGKPADQSYLSQRVLGQMFRKIEEPNSQAHLENLGHFVADPRVVHEDAELYYDAAVSFKGMYDIELQSLMAQYGLGSEHEAFTSFIMTNTDDIMRKRDYDLREAVHNTFVQVQKRFRSDIVQFVLKCDDVLAKSAISKETKKKLEPFVVAMYRITYDQSAHGEDHKGASEDLSTRLISFPWIFSDILCQMVTGTDHHSDEKEFAEGKDDEPELQCIVLEDEDLDDHSLYVTEDDGPTDSTPIASMSSRPTAQDDMLESDGTSEPNQSEQEEPPVVVYQKLVLPQLDNLEGLHQKLEIKTQEDAGRFVTADELAGSNESDDHRS